MTGPRLPKRQKEAGETVARRRQLLDRIAAEAAATARLTGRRAFAKPVMEALARVPRHEFVPQDRAREAYVNAPLPIGFGQTISQPYIVALMTDLLDLTDRCKVLEVGTGCGYQAAVLAELAGTVCTLEIVPELAAAAGERLTRLGYRNVVAAAGDASVGWPEHAPFDAILVAAAAPEIPSALVAQLKPGGRMVVPVGTERFAQDLVLLTKDTAGRVEKRAVLPVAFVPLTHHPSLPMAARGV